AAGEQPGQLELRLPAARARAVGRLDADRPRVPLFPFLPRTSPPLLHRRGGDGLTPTDLVFPFFLFIVGITPTFSIGGMVERGASGRELFRKVLIRSVVIFVLGLALQGFPDYDLRTVGAPGVLQR